MEDSKDRRQFPTGAVRDVTNGKGWYAGISPIAMRRLAIVLQKGAEKYEPRNWEKGIVLSSFWDSAVRHLCQWSNGEVDEDHLGQAFWNIMALIHTEAKVKEGKLPEGLGDMGPSTKAEPPGSEPKSVCMTQENYDKLILTSEKLVALEAETKWKSGGLVDISSKEKLQEFLKK
jgi:hypothetical protein